MSNFAYLLLAIALRAFTSFQLVGRRLAGFARCWSTSRSSWQHRLPSAVFYICAQRELHPRTWMKEILFLPCLLALGIGLSLNNARAVLEAMIQSQIGFCADAKVRNRTQIAALAELQIQAAQVGAPARGAGVCHLFQLLRCVCDHARAIFLGAVFADVPGRIPLRLSQFLLAVVGQNSILAVHGRGPQFPRDKSKLSSKRFGQCFGPLHSFLV